MIQLKASYDHLYLSPHFDDVALSCGGQLFRRAAMGDTVLVVTITGAEPPNEPLSATVASLHRRWADSLDQTPAAMVAQRRAEDQEACDVLRADVLHLSFLDCIYRAGPDGQPLYPGPTDMFGVVHPDDEITTGRLIEALAELPPAERAYLPLSVGGHVDHVLTRRAGEQTFGDVAYYEDYPYTLIPGALEAVLPAVARGEWRAETLWLTEAALAAKIESVSAYRSQISSFFAGLDDLAVKLRLEGHRVLDAAQADGEAVPGWAVGAERLWRPRSRPLVPAG